MFHRHLLATDLDGALAGNEKSLQDLVSYFYKRQIVPYLVYITDRHLQSAQNLIKDENLPSPDVLITDTGGGVYVGNQLKEDVDWRTHLQENWNPESISKLMVTEENHIRQRLPNKKKVSFVSWNSDNIQDSQRILIRENISHRFIYKEDKYIDIIPVNSGKENALHYVLQNMFHENIRVLIAVGDSENDYELLTLGYPSVIVGNAPLELQCLKEMPYVYKAKYKYAAGIKEAWEYFYP